MPCELERMSSNEWFLVGIKKQCNYR